MGGVQNSLVVALHSPFLVLVVETLHGSHNGVSKRRSSFECIVEQRNIPAWKKRRIWAVHQATVNSRTGAHCHDVAYLLRGKLYPCNATDPASLNRMRQHFTKPQQLRTAVLLFYALLVVAISPMAIFCSCHPHTDNKHQPAQFIIRLDPGSPRANLLQWQIKSR
jgi:hypothetical protein